jgi:exodeoxyribonuclease VII small subunit
MATRKKNIDFEACLQQLESIVEVLEEGNLGLEESLKSFEKGIKITRDCQQALKNAEQRVRILTSDPSGAVSDTDFMIEDDE